MTKRELSVSTHVALLVLFALGSIGLWMLPVLLAGFPAELSYIIRDAHILFTEGILPESSAKLTTVVFAGLQRFIGWDEMVSWSLVNTALFALGFFPLWWCTQKHTDRTVAWLTVAIYAYMPMYWYKAIRVDGYALALTLLFTSYAAYLLLKNQRHMTAFLISGFLFGLCIAAKSAFITFLPFLALAYVWYRRSDWMRSGLLVGAFCLLAYMGMVTPFLFQPKVSFGDRIVQMLPSTEEKIPGTGHLYPDDYTYEFLKEEFDEYTKNRIENSSFLVRQEDLHYRLIFNVGDSSVKDYLLSSAWLLFTALPPLFVQETVGGAFLWIFILPGIVLLYKKDRIFTLWLLGLWISMEVLLRFVLHFGRDHLMDVGWQVAMFAGIGMAALARDLSERINVSKIVIFMIATLLVTLQLAQSSRKYLTHLYERSTVPETYAATNVLDALPESAVVAHPRKHDAFFFSSTNNISIHSPTLAFLAARNRLHEPFIHYGVTHLYGYTNEEVDLIHSALPALVVVEPGEPQGITITPRLKFLLHLIR